MGITIADRLIPPIIGEYQRTQMRRILWHFLGWQTVIALTLAFAFGLDDPRFPVSIAFGVHTLVCAILNYYDRLFFPRLTMPVFWFAVSALLSGIGHGIHDISMSVFPLSIICASILLGRRGLVVFTVASLGAMLVMVWGELTGNLPIDPTGYTSYMDLGYLVLTYGALGMTLWVAIGYWSALLKRSQRQQRELSENEARFRAIADHTFHWEN